MTLKLDNPITEWQENRLDNKPYPILPLSFSGPVWFVVKLTRKNVFGVYDFARNEWLHSGNEIYADDEIGWFIELPTSTFNHVPQELKCLLTSDIASPSNNASEEWALITDLAYNYQNIMPPHYLQNGNYGFHEWLIKGCPELQKIEFTFDHECNCAHYFFKSDEQAFKFVGVVNKFMEAQFRGNLIDPEVEQEPGNPPKLKKPWTGLGRVDQ